MLRVGDLGFLRSEAKERRVEILDLRKDGSGPHVMWVVQHLPLDSRSEELFVRIEADRFDSIAQVAPELVDCARTRETARHPYDCDLSERIGNVNTAHLCSHFNSGCERSLDNVGLTILFGQSRPHEPSGTSRSPASLSSGVPQAS